MKGDRLRGKTILFVTRDGTHNDALQLILRDHPSTAVIFKTVSGKAATLVQDGKDIASVLSSNAVDAVVVVDDAKLSVTALVEEAQKHMKTSDLKALCAIVLLHSEDQRAFSTMGLSVVPEVVNKRVTYKSTEVPKYVDLLDAVAEAIDNPKPQGIGRRRFF
ncbi:MAG: hypothetical protein K2X03_10975 [Bryobacteraceae bacterium]|nr:hypothetical protein [Bryobacteraceae bacterium]